MKTVVITGSSRGFGFCLAREFRRMGCNVVISAVNGETPQEGRGRTEKRLARGRRAFGRFLTAGFRKRDFFA